jgi:hypothetical protein
MSIMAHTYRKLQRPEKVGNREQISVTAKLLSRKCICKEIIHTHTHTHTHTHKSEWAYIVRKN